jgi:hypothetical protein
VRPRSQPTRTNKGCDTCNPEARGNKETRRFSVAVEPPASGGGKSDVEMQLHITMNMSTIIMPMSRDMAERVRDALSGWLERD